MRADVPLTESAEDRALRARTLPGQAHWAIGPETCRECVFWAGGNRYSVGTLRPAICRKAQQLHAAAMVAVPQWAPSCKYFEPNASPPALIQERKIKP